MAAAPLARLRMKVPWRLSVLIGVLANVGIALLYVRAAFGPQAIEGFVVFDIAGLLLFPVVIVIALTVRSSGQDLPIIGLDVALLGLAILRIQDSLRTLGEVSRVDLIVAAFAGTGAIAFWIALRERRAQT